MRIDRQPIVSALRSLGHHHRADEAATQLPALVDTQRDAALLDRLGIDVHTLLRGSELGGLLSTLGF